jgi:hypothetical protein
MESLLLSSDEEMKDERVFLAAIHGVDLNKSTKGGQSNQSSSQSVSSNNDDNFMFKDPKEYGSMSEDEKEAATKSIMDKIKSFGALPISKE